MQNNVCVLSNYIIYQEFQDHSANSVDQDEVAHYELPHLGLHCSQIQLFSVLGAFSVSYLFPKCQPNVSTFFKD